MKKIRILSIISLLVCIVLLSIGAHHFDISSPEARATVWPWALLTIFACYGVISATSVTALSFFALQSSEQGLLIVKRDSAYGRIFLRLTSLDERRRFSLCQAFWKTNLLLATSSFMLGVCIVALVALFQIIIANPLSLLFAIILAVLVIGVLVLFIFSLDAVLRRIDRVKYQLEQRAPRVVQAAGMTCYFGVRTLVLAAFALAIYKVGLGVIWQFLVTWIPWIFLLAVCIVAALGLFYGFYRIIKATIGEEFVSFYHHNLCPRIEMR